MSWKEGLLLILILCAVVIACLARHFFGDVEFLAEHLIAASSVYLPGLLQWIAGHLR